MALAVPNLSIIIPSFHPLLSAAAIGVVQRLASVNVAFFSCSSFEHVLQLVNHARAHLGEILSAVEFLDAEGLACVKENAGLQSPLPDPAPFYVLIETHGSNMDHDQEKLQVGFFFFFRVRLCSLSIHHLCQSRFVPALLIDPANSIQSFVEVAMDKQVATDGTVAQDGRQGAAIWQVRERISESLQHDGWVYKYDVSLPLKSFYELVELMRQRVSGLAKRCVGFGHLGDGKAGGLEERRKERSRRHQRANSQSLCVPSSCPVSVPQTSLLATYFIDHLLFISSYSRPGNLHLNVTSREPRDELLARIEPFIYEFTAKCRGSISAEHGLGLMKPHHIVS